MNRFKILFTSLMLFAILSISFVTRTNAMVTLCKYKGLYNAYVNGNAYYTELTITLQDDRYILSASLPEVYQSAHFTKKACEIVKASPNNMITFNWSFNTSLSLFKCDCDSYNAAGQPVYNPVTWINTGTDPRTNLTEKGICPEIIAFGYEDPTLGFEPRFQMGANNNNSWNEYYNKILNGTETKDETWYTRERYINFYLEHDKECTKYYYPKSSDGTCQISLFGDASTNQLSTDSSTCSTDEERLQYMSDTFAMKIPGFEWNVSTLESGRIARFYKGNGYDQFANNAITTYSPSSKCYTSNKALQPLYDEITTNARSLLSKLNTTASDDDVDDCKSIIGSGTFRNHLNQVFRFVQFVGPAVVILLTIFEYIKVAALSDASLLKKTNSRTIIRLVAALALFLIPIVIKLLLNIFGFYGDCLDTIL